MPADLGKEKFRRSITSDRTSKDAPMLILAHRGAHDPETPSIRENTLDAFRAAGDLGIGGVELDVRRTAAGSLLVHHDTALPDGRPIAELGEDRPDWVPTLTEALDACARLALVNIEIKASPLEPGYDPTQPVALALAATVLARGGAASLLVSSFNLGALDVFHAAAPAVSTGWLTMPGYDQMAAVASSASAGHTAINLPDAATTPELIGAAHDAGLRVVVWTVNDPDRMRQLADLGADVIVTDRPALARSVLRQ